MKKFISLFLVLALVLSMAACGSTSTKEAAPTAANAPAAETQAQATEAGPAEVELKPYKIAVAFTQINATALAQQKYLQEYVAPAFNVEFMFSEAVDSAETAMTFIENAYAAGCQGILNFENSSVEQINAKANELGMYIVSNSPKAENSDLPYVMGYVAGSVSDVANLYKDVVAEVTSDGQKHNVVIISAGAGLGNEQHYDCTYAMLESLQDIYGLTYSDTIENLASSRGMMELETGSDVKILLYPGYPNSDTYVSGLSTMLQTGDYDVVLGCNQATAKFSVAIDEVERAYNTDIKVSYFSSVDDATTAGFQTTDAFGNSSINSVLINPGNMLIGTMFAVLYNGISGNGDAIRCDGEGYRFNSPMWMAGDADAYMAIAALNGTDGNHELSIEEIQNMLVIYNPGTTYQTISDELSGLTADAVLSARGLK